MTPGRDRNRARARRLRARDVERCVANHDRVARGDAGSAGLRDVRHRPWQQPIALRRIVAVRAAAEVVPQIEVLELYLCAGLEVTGEQGEVNVVARRQGVEQRADAGHDPLAGSGLVELLAQVM